jgi:transcriptional regulator with XRE-family HTH domain
LSPSQPQGHSRVAFLPLVRVRLKCPRPKAYSQNPQTIGEHIKKRRLKLGLTQKQAAKALALNPWTVLNWETGQHQPPIRSIPRILAFLGYDPFPPPTSVGEQLLHLRRQHGWSTTKAARQLGVDRATWQDWEHGELILFRSHRLRVAAVLGLDPQALVGEMRARWNGKHRRWDRNHQAEPVREIHTQNGTGTSGTVLPLTVQTEVVSKEKLTESLTTRSH